MKVRKHKEKNSGKWQVLELTKYEAETLASQTDNLRDMAEGRITGSVIGGVNLEIKITD